jgi:hypothetical protein
MELMNCLERSVGLPLSFPLHLKNGNKKAEDMRIEDGQAIASCPCDLQNCSFAGGIDRLLKELGRFHLGRHGEKLTTRAICNG